MWAVLERLLVVADAQTTKQQSPAICIQPLHLEKESDWFTRLIEYLCWQGRDIGCGDQFSGALKATAAWVDVELNYGRALKANGYV